jgi:FemAB-related protein (PEP-CTERM system-associated)
LAGDAAAAARRLGVDLLELRARAPVPADLRVSHRKVAVVLALPDSPEALWRRFPPKLRAQIRRPEKEGLVARFGPEQQAAFYHVFARHMRDLGTPVLPRALFERIARVFPRHVVFAAVYRDREPLAAGCGFVWGDEFEITWAADLRAHRRAAPNMLLYWALMRHMIERGVRAFNFGRCTLGAGTHRFKRQWGGEDVPLPWAQWTSGAVSATPSPDRPVYRLAAAVWRRLPLPLANAVGPALARQLP